MYNGSANYETWNVAVWIDNDEGLYHLACGALNYADFVAQLKECAADTPIAYQTPDGVSWTDSGLDTAELDAHIQEMQK